MDDSDALSSTVAATDEIAGLAHTLTAERSSAAPSAAPSEALPIGDNRYELREELGAGGMGRVYNALDRQFSREVAVKQLLDEGTLEARERFATEALVTGNLEHPGIPSVYERGGGDGSPMFYAMRKVRGRTLKAALSESRDLSERLKLVPAIVRVAQTLAYAHSQGVIHRDIKPSNIVIGKYGETFVLDWGIAKVRGIATTTSTKDSGVASTDSSQTAYGSVIGTPAYMAPEQAAGNVDVLDERTDVFALGAILYHLLSGRAPYHADTIDSVLDQARTGEWEPIETAAPKAPRALRVICDKAMSRGQDERYQSATEIAHDLESFTSDAVAHQDTGPVGWFAKLVVVLSSVIALTGIVFAFASVPMMYEQGWGAYFALIFATIGILMSVAEFATRGRYRLSPLIIAFALVTFLAGVAGAFTGLDVVLRGAGSTEVFDDLERYRTVLTFGVREAMGNMVIGSGLAAAQLLAWAVARRRTLVAARH